MNDIILFALKAEAPTLFQYANVFEIGVGKVNAAINTALICERYRPKRIINLGTAGGVKLLSDIHRVNYVFQHDVNLTGLGLGPGYQFNDRHSFIQLSGQGHTCASGDIHVTEKRKIRMDCDMVDMEAYSIAKTCLIKKIECEIWKYISDQADEYAGTTWQEQVAAGEDLYKKVLQDLNVKLLEV